MTPPTPVQRYDFDGDYVYCGCTITADNDGEYVLYTDYLALAAELADAERERDALQARWGTLVDDDGEPLALGDIQEYIAVLHESKEKLSEKLADAEDEWAELLAKLAEAGQERDDAARTAATAQGE